MGIAERHLKGSVARQLTDGAKIHACHNQPTGKGVPIAMPSELARPYVRRERSWSTVGKSTRELLGASG
jgi:hypothetical protein